MGNIGDNPREFELEPLDIPAPRTEPAPQPVPAQPVQPVKEPVPA